MKEEVFSSNGTCLCGAVTYQATFKNRAGACHCTICRQWCGGPYMAVHAIGKVNFRGEEQLGIYKSSQWASRGFCKQCGASLFYHLLPRPGLPDGEYMMAAGTLQDQSQLVFDNEVFVDKAPGWYQFADEDSRTRMTEAELFAKYEPQDK